MNGLYDATLKDGQVASTPGSVPSYDEPKYSHE